MRDIPTSITELQLSSPLPSPSQQNTNNTARNNEFIPSMHTNTSPCTLNSSSNNNNNISASHSVTSTITLPSLQSSPLYPLASKETPLHLKRFNFEMNGKSCTFEEINTMPTRKRTASVWDEEDNEKSCKRTELINQVDNDEDEDQDIYADDIIPESPNSALPSPISDIEQDWPVETMEDTFDALPEQIQTYALFQLLKRSHRSTLKVVRDSILDCTRKDILLSVPIKIAHLILSFLDIPSLCRASGVSHGWRELIDNATETWRLKMIENNFTPSLKEEYCILHSVTNPYKAIVRRHTIMRRNWTQNKHRKLLLQGHEGRLITCLQFDDEKIITGFADSHRIHLYDINTGQLKNVMEGHEGDVWALEYVGNTLVTGSIDRTVRVWDIKRGLCRFVLRGHTSTIRCLKIVMPTMIDNQLQPSEPLIISGSRDMTIRVWKLPNLNDLPLPLFDAVEDDFISRRYLKYTLKEHENAVRDIAVHGNTLVSGGYDYMVIVWDLATGRSKHILKGHTMKVYCVAIDPKRRHCISGSMDFTVRIWGLDDGECKFVLQGHAILVGLIGLVDDCLVSAAADHTLRTWDPATGDRRRIFAGHRGPITAFQHDQYKIISGSEGAVKMWNTQTGELMHDLIQDVQSVWRISFNERRCIAAVKNDGATQLVVLDFGIHGLEES